MKLFLCSPSLQEWKIRSCHTTVSDRTMKLFLCSPSLQEWKIRSCHTTVSDRTMKLFLCFPSLHEWKIRSCHTTVSAYNFSPYYHHTQNFPFLTNGWDMKVSLRLRSTTSITTITRWGRYYGNTGFLNTHCDNAATNSNSKNAKSRMAASLQGTVGTGTKGDESSTGRVWAVGFHHIGVRSRLARILKLMNRLFL